MYKYMKYILSIDGGGSYGIAVISFLQEMEKELNMNIFEKFDCFAGSSVGGIISLGIVGNQTRYNDYKKVYHLGNYDAMSDILYSEWYRKYLNWFIPYVNPKNKSRVLKSVLPCMPMSELSKDVLITSVDINSMESIIYTRESNENIQKVADKTSAAPTYFYPVENEIDGGCALNNPSLLAYYYGLKKYGEGNFKILSIQKINSRDEKSRTQVYGTLDFLMNTSFLLAGSMHYSDDICKQKLNNHYIRFDVDPNNFNIVDCSKDTYNKMIKGGIQTFHNNKEQLEKFLLP